MKAVYILLQIFRILVTLIFISSNIAYFFIGALQDPNSTLIEWSRHHKYLISISFALFFYLPVGLIFWGAFINMGNIASSIWQKDPASRILAPQNFTVLLSLLTFLGLLIPAFIISF